MTEITKSARLFLRSLCVLSALTVGAGGALAACGPFTDVAADAFCPFVLEIFYLGITTGTTATTYSPSGNVTRLQMAAFLSRSVDSALKRGSRRAPLGQFWTTTGVSALGLTTLPAGALTPWEVKSDGADLWVASSTTNSGSVTRVRASDGRVLETWTGSAAGEGLLVAFGRILVLGSTSPGGKLYAIDPAQTAGSVTTVATNLGDFPFDGTFDGGRVWTANGVSVSIVTPAAAPPWTVTTVTAGITFPLGAGFDGSNVWITDTGPQSLLKLSSSGAVLQTVTFGGGGTVQLPLFDGSNFWVPIAGPDSVAVVRASNGAVLATLTGNGLNNPAQAAFDGQRILVTNFGGDSVSLWKAADLSPIGSFPTGATTFPSMCASDGINFWVVLQSPRKLARF